MLGESINPKPTNKTDTDDSQNRRGHEQFNNFRREDTLYRLGVPSAIVFVSLGVFGGGCLLAGRPACRMKGRH
jgi:hypothetical protein